MKKFFFLALSATLLSMPLALAQQTEEGATTNWTTKGVTGFNLSQTALSNWAAGGENTFAGNVYLNLAANYKKDLWSWDNAFNTDFGMTHTTSNGWLKSVDKIELTSKVGYAFSQNWNAAFMANFLTQYALGYKNPTDKKDNIPYISKFMAPGYLTLALGSEYKPNEEFSLLLSPLTGKVTFVQDDYLSSIGAFGVTPGKRFLAELGASVVANLNTKLTDNINYISKLSLFTAYTHDFGNIDVLWDNMLAMKINKYLTTTITVNMLYDDDVRIKKADGTEIGPRLQIREILGLGVAYSF